MKPILLSIVLLICAIPAPAAGDATAIGGPVAGFVFDQKLHALRPMLGVPGAAYLGDGVLADLDAAAVAPDGDRALAVRQGAVMLVTRLKSSPEAAALEGVIDGVDLLAFSADGATAALFSSQSRRAQVLRDLMKTPAAGDPIDLTALDGAVTALAVSGEDLLLGVAAEAGGVYLCAAGAAPRLLAAAAAPSALAIRGRDAWFADRERRQVWQVRNFATEATPLLFAADLDSPVGLQLSGNRLYVASAGSRTLDVFDLDARSGAGRIDLEFTPATLAAFGDKPLWLMNAGDGEEPLYVLEGGDQPAVYFVPAGREN